LALAPLLAASLAVPILDEPLTLGLMLGLLGMVTGALQPWKWVNFPLQTTVLKVKTKLSYRNAIISQISINYPQQAKKTTR
jgi:hypothetical protein